MSVNEPGTDTTKDFTASEYKIVRGQGRNIPLNVHVFKC
jgi:hypothetical protein